MSILSKTSTLLKNLTTQNKPPTKTRTEHPNKHIHSPKEKDKKRQTVSKPLPTFGEPPTNLPPLENVDSKKTKEVSSPLPPSSSLPKIILPIPIIRQLTKTKPQIQTSKPSTGTQQTINSNPIRKIFYTISNKNKFNKLTNKTRQTFKKVKNKAKNLFKKGIGKLTKKLALKAGTILVGAATGIGLVIGAAEAVIGVGKFIAKNKEIVLAIGSWLMLKFAALLANTLALVGTVTGAIIGGIIGSVFGPLGAIVGASIGATIGGTIGNALFNWIQSHGGVGNLTQNAIYGPHIPTINPINGKFGGTTRIGGAADLVTGYASPTLVPAGLIGIPLFSTLGIAAFSTFFVMIVILTAFTVPNPLGTSTSAVLGEDLQCNSAQPNSTSTWTDMQTAAAQACIPVDILAAIMQTESGAYGLTDEQYQTLSVNGWWENVNIDGKNVNCYDSQYQKDNNGNLTQCGEGYCYDTCTATGLCGGKISTCTTDPNNTTLPQECSVTSPGPLPCPADGQCTSRDVYGIMQFERSTFHGSNCNARDGINVSSPEYCTAGSGGTGNRCNAQNSIFAAAKYIANRIGVSCPYDPNKWNLARFCQAAKTYCGSCGTVENNVTEEMYKANPETYPCYPYYGNTGDPSGACTSINPDTGNAEGYCDKVFRMSNCTIN